MQMLNAVSLAFVVTLFLLQNYICDCRFNDSQHIDHGNRFAEIVWKKQVNPWATWDGIGFCRGSISLLYPLIPHSVCEFKKCIWSDLINAFIDIDLLISPKTTVTDPPLCSKFLVKNSLVYQGETESESNYLDSSKTEYIHTAHKNISSDSKPGVTVSFIFVLREAYDSEAALRSIIEIVRFSREIDRWELIVVDDSGDVSASSSVKYLCELLQQLFEFLVTFNKNKSPLGIVASSRDALPHVKGNFVILLYKEIVFTPGSIAALISVLQTRGDVGIVGPLALNSDLTIRNVGGIIYRYGETAAVGKGLKRPINVPMLHTRPVDFIADNGIIVFRRNLFLELQLPDVEYTDISVAIQDASIKLLKNGILTYIQPFSVVVIPPKISAQNQYKDEVMLQDISRFTLKFANEFSFACPRLCRMKEKERTSAYFATLQSQDTHILVLDNITPEPDRDSGSVRMFEILNILRNSLGYTVSYESMKFRDVKYLIPLLGIGINVLPFGTFDSISKSLTKNGTNAIKVKVIIIQVTICIFVLFYLPMIPVTLYS